VFNLGPANDLRAYGIECGFDMKDTIRAVEHLFLVASYLKSRGIVHSTPPSLRFVAGSPAPLAMMNGRPTMMLEMGMFVCANGADELLTRYEKTFMEGFRARPHWGLDLNQVRGWDTVRRLSPNAESFRAHYEELNRTGVFNGPFTDRLCMSIRTNGSARAAMSRVFSFGRS
jgi:hypothetical protein